MPDYQPAWWLSNPHAQTIWASLIRTPPKVNTWAEQVELPDGDLLDLRWTENTHGPIVLVLHGLEGCIDSNYIQGILFAIVQKGWRGVLMHFRNCGPHPNRLARGYHAGDTHDLEYVLKLLKKREPRIPLAAIGYSLGGNALLKWLGESPQAVCIQGAVAVSVPFMLEKAMSRLETGFSRIYHWYFLRLLKRSALRKSHLLPPSISPAFIKALPSIRQFDNQITAPLHGFQNAAHYYAVASCRQYLKTIAIPTLILHAKDDPFMTQDAIPQREDLSAYIRLELSSKGGHVGFISGIGLLGSYGWLEKRIPQFLSEVLD